MRVPTANFTAAALQRFVRRRSPRRVRPGTEGIDIFVVCSVVPKKNGVVRSAAKRSRILWLTPRVELGVGIDYPNPKTIGADRLANAAAVAALYGCPAIVVDFATGGYADLIAARLREIDAVHSNLTLEGLRIVANLNA